MIHVVATLNSEDLERYRRVDARYGALHANPRAYTAEESERIIYEWQVLCGELIERYEVELDELWRISAADGTIYYEDA